MRWPPMFACPARNSRSGLPMKADCKVPPGQLGNCVQGKIRVPPRPTKRARLPVSAQPGQPRAARCRVALRSADWRWEMKGKVSLASGQAPLRVGRDAAPATLVDAPALRSANPEARNSRPPRPTNPRAKLSFASFLVCHEGCFRPQPQELLYYVPPQCRIPLAREPSALGTPPPPADPA